MQLISERLNKPRFVYPDKLTHKSGLDVVKSHIVGTGAVEPTVIEWIYSWIMQEELIAKDNYNHQPSGSEKPDDDLTLSV